MRNFIFSIVLGVATLVPGLAYAAPTGAVMQADPQLTQTWWTTMAVRDGVRERDEVSINRNGQKIADGLVVSVQGDHSSVMLKGTNVPTLEKGDVVLLVRHARPVADVTPAKPGQTLGYKVVGGHSLLSIDTINAGDNNMDGEGLGLGASSISLSSGLTVISPSFSGSLGISNNLGIGSGLGFGSLGLPSGLGINGLGFGNGLGINP